MLDELSALGFGPFFEEQLAGAPTGDVVARIAAEHRGAYEVWTAAAAGPAQLAGRLRRAADEAGLPGVGDWVVLREPPGPERTAIIERVLARRTVFTRGAAGREARTQVIAANVDLVFAVCGLDLDFNVHRIERYLARIWASGARPAVILNKADVCPDVAARSGRGRAPRRRRRRPCDQRAAGRRGRGGAGPHRCRPDGGPGRLVGRRQVDPGQRADRRRADADRRGPGPRWPGLPRDDPSAARAPARRWPLARHPGHARAATGR